MRALESAANLLVYGQAYYTATVMLSSIMDVTDVLWIIYVKGLLLRFTIK